MKGLDVLVVDLQDVGTRIYTYIYTMAYCLTAAEARRRQGDRLRSPESDRWHCSVEGPMLAQGFESFVGLYPIPMRHGMTIGELARLFNDHFGIGADLEVVHDGGMAARDVSRRCRGAVGDAVAEHADARHRDRLSGNRAVRGNERVGGPRDDAAVRTSRRAVGRR